MKRINSGILSNLTVYSVAHLLVDATCAALVFGALASYSLSASDFFILIVLYNVLAFGSQALFGLAVDKFRKPILSAQLGILLTILSAPILIFTGTPIVAIIFAGIGNSLFHIGGGTIALNLAPKKATFPGIFVAPGAIGLLIGTMGGKLAPLIIWPLLLLLIIFCALISFIKPPVINYERKVMKFHVRNFDLVLVLLLLVIAVRSFVGLNFSFAWKSDFILLLALTVGIFLGKSLGGILSDKYGWAKVAAGALLISAPLLTFGGSTPVLAILGMFLFNMTMPVTMVAISNRFPGRPAFSFGLTCLGLIIGAMLIFFGIGAYFKDSMVVLDMILFSSLLLFIGLKLLYRIDKNSIQ